VAEALPFIQAALGLAQLVQTFQGPQVPPMPEKPPTLGWDEAMRRATETLTPIYDERLQKTLEGVDKELIARGFFGQLPGAALAGARAADVERAKAAAIAALGGQMQSQSEEQALAQQRLAAEWAINQSNLWNQMQQQRQQGILGSLNYWNMFRELFPTTWTNWFGKQPSMADVGNVAVQGWPMQPAPALSVFQQPLTLGQSPVGGMSQWVKPW
jgi:hypothetical protein